MKLPALVTALVVVILPVITASVAADSAAPYAGQQNRSVKALSEDEIAGLLKGEGMGMAKAAELNGYPGPAHIIALAPRLELTDAQRREVQAIFDRMNAAARTLGAQIVAREQELDRQFRDGNIAADRLIGQTQAIAELQGRLRSVHLAAHLEARPVLTPRQIALYQQLRGYHDGLHHHHPG